MVIATKIKVIYLCIYGFISIYLFQVMTVMGLDSRLSWLAWFFNTYLGMVLMSFIVTALLTLGNQFKYSDPVLVFVFLATFSFSTTMMGYVAVKKFRRRLLCMNYLAFPLA